MKSLFVRFPALLVAIVLLAGPSWAADGPTASHLAAARELIQMTGALGTADDMLTAFEEQIKHQAVSRPDLTKDLDEVFKALKPELDLQKEKAKEVVTQTYAKWLTEDEIKAAITFFKTPAGAKYLKVQPDLVEDVVNALQAWAQQASEYVMVRTRAEMAKRGHAMQ